MIGEYGVPYELICIIQYCTVPYGSYHGVTDHLPPSLIPFCLMPCLMPIGTVTLMKIIIPDRPIFRTRDDTNHTISKDCTPYHKNTWPSLISYRLKTSQPHMIGLETYSIDRK